MSIRPIEAQMLYQNTPETAKIRSAENNKDSNMLAQSTQNMQKKIEKDAQSVKDIKKTEKAKIEKRQNKEKKDDDKEKKKNNNDNETEHIDIRI